MSKEKLLRVNLLGLLALIGIGCSTAVDTQKNTPVYREPVRSVLLPSADSLSIKSYSTWLVKQRSLCYDEVENDRLRISLLYKPIEYETAMSSEDRASFLKLMEQKKGFQYWLVECWDKNTSAVNPTDKNKFQLKLKQAIRVAIGSDTLIPMVESFPPTVSGQPYQVLVWAPSETQAQNLSAWIAGEVLGVEDLKITLNEKQVRALPKIKI